MRIPIRVLLPVMLCAIGTSASASVFTFADRAVFDAATDPQIQIDFEVAPAGAVCSVRTTQDPCVLETQGVTFATTVAVPAGDDFLGPRLRIDAGLGGTLSKGLDSDAIPVAANDFYWNFLAHDFGLDLVTADPSGHIYVVALTDVNDVVYDFNVNATSGAGAFFGFSSDVIIRSMSIFDSCPDNACTNFLIDGIATTLIPEPSAFALIALGLAGIGVARRARKR